NSPKAYYAPLSQEQVGRVDILVGAFMLMRKSRYVEVGGLDEDYFMYGEDIDLSYKFLKSGYQNYYVGTETVLHYKVESTARDKTYLLRFYEVMRIFYTKHFQESSRYKNFVYLGLKLAKASHTLRQKKTLQSIRPKTYVWVGAPAKLISVLEKKWKTN